MILAPGARLGPYEITAKLGEGGMGQVFQAKDFQLGRNVALKVLPEGFTQDPERLARFEREAKLLAQLNHPNIAQIYGFETSGDTRALVMELVDGPTLAERLEQGPFPFNESLSVSLQIAHALEEAHEKGIVHRDLKPQNIKASIEGKVKVLDFGLAKAMDPAAGSAASAADMARSPTLMQSPTLTAVHGTQLGMILGTAAYMAPEQAKGLPIDKRADIWAFGVVLYEMLVGRSLFAGDTVTDTLAGVLKTEIDFQRLPDSTPAAVRRLLRRCLERNPRNRLHDIADARIVLEEVQSGAHDEPPAAAGASPAAGRPSGRALARLLAVAALAAVVGVGAGWLLRRPGPADPGAGARWALAIPDGLVLSTGDFTQLALSEDGRLQVAVVVDSTAISRLLLRSSDELAPKLLPETEGAVSPFFSPDGEWVGFFRDRSLFKIPVRGGPAVEIASIAPVAVTRGAAWSRDGFIYLAPGVSTGLSRISENGGPLATVTELDQKRGERTHRWPQALPDGSAVLFTSDTQTSIEFYDDARIEAVRPATGERRVVVEGSSQARYATGERLVFARGGSLYSIDFDPSALTVRGAPELAAQGVATDVGSGAVQFALSVSGAALWAPGSLTAGLQLFWVERSGDANAVAISPLPFTEAALSPDGKRVALVGGAAGVSDLWVADLERGAQTRLTMGDSVAFPVWSPDGARIAYSVRPVNEQERGWQIVWRLADGSRDAEVLIEGEQFVRPSGFTADGRRLLYAASKPDGPGLDVFLVPVAGARTPELLLGGSGGKRDAVISPDGRWFAYTSTESGAPTVFVRPFPAGEGRWQISTPLGFEPRWSRDQRELYYRADSALYRVAIDTRNGISAGKPERLVDRASSNTNLSTYTPAADGRIFTARSPESLGSLRQLYLDLGFARRIAPKSRTSSSRP